MRNVRNLILVSGETLIVRNDKLHDEIEGNDNAVSTVGGRPIGMGELLCWEEACGCVDICSRLCVFV